MQVLCFQHVTIIFNYFHFTIAFPYSIHYLISMENMKLENNETKGLKMKNLPYGIKRDYPKIDLYFKGKYVCSTTWAKTLKIAKDAFIAQEMIQIWEVDQVTAKRG